MTQRTREDLEKELIELRDVNFKLHEKIDSANGAMGEYQQERREYVARIQALESALLVAHQLLGIYLRGDKQ